MLLGARIKCQGHKSSGVCVFLEIDCDFDVLLWETVNIFTCILKHNVYSICIHVQYMYNAAKYIHMLNKIMLFPIYLHLID